MPTTTPMTTRQCGFQLREEWRSKSDEREDLPFINVRFGAGKRHRRREIGAQYGQFRLSQKRKEFWRKAITALKQQRATTKPLNLRFEEQAERWYRETAHMSSPLHRMVHPSYQAILGMADEGPEQKREVIALMLCDLKGNRRDWLLALSYLTQQNPIDSRDAGRMDRMVSAWVAWGEAQALI